MMETLDMTKGQRAVRQAEILTLPIDGRLKSLIGQAADNADMPMNEWVALKLADILGVPELAKIPRKSIGRPRNDMLNGKNGNGHKRKAVGAA